MVLTQFSWNIPVLARQGLRHLLLVHIHVQCAILMGHGPLTRYVNLRVAHAPRMAGTFSPPPWASDSDMHHGTCMTHVPWCIPGSLTSGFLWIWWQGKRSRHSRCMRNPQFYVLVRGPCHLLTFTETFIRVPYHLARGTGSVKGIAYFYVGNGKGVAYFLKTHQANSNSL